MPQLRQNFITREWVVIAPERAKRPDDFIEATSLKKKPAVEKCIFCVGEKVYKDREKGFETEEIYVVKNKFPAYVEDPTLCSTRSFRVEDDFYSIRPSVGGHDVVTVKDPNTSLPHFSQKIWVEMLEMFRKRYQYFDKICNAEYTMPIYNHGATAGASIEHPHAQIFISPVVPNVVQRELRHTKEYFDSYGECAFCKMLVHEKKEKIRLLAENGSFLAHHFFAARFPFEIWVLPKRHCSRFEEITKKEIEDLASICREIFGKLDKLLKDPPVNFFIHNAPNSVGKVPYYHWHLEIGPRLAKYGGYELGSGVIIDVMSPEEAAQYLKKVK